jgi:hypothetical protein
MILLRAFPFLALVLIAYNILIVLGGRSVGDVVGEVTLPSGAVWSIATGDALVIAALALLFVEMVSASSRTASVINHGLSLLVFLICLVEFLLVRACGTPEFLFITLITMIDVIAGYSISIRAARRDFSVEQA